MESMTLLLRVLVLIGYPVISMSQPFTGYAISEPYRAFVFLLSLAVFAISLKPTRKSHLDLMLMLFLLVYGIRLVHDWAYAGIAGADRANLLFWVMVFVPVLASMRLGTVDEAPLAKWASHLGHFVLVMTIAAYSLGLNFNPWDGMGPATANTQRLQFEGLNPISLGHVAGLVLICNTFLLVDQQAKGLRRLMLVGGMILAVIVMVLANSRGPVLAAGLALAFFLLSRSWRLARLAPVLLIAGLLLDYFLSQNQQILNNIWTRFTEDSALSASDLGRIESQTSAMRAFLDNPIFGAFYRDPELAENAYPHNLVLEAAMALGLVGLIMFVALHIRAAIFMFSRTGKQHPLMIMLLLQQFIAVSLSGAIWGGDVFFMLLGVCLTLRSRPNTQMQTGFWAAARPIQSRQPAADLR